jgi:hypothetical protein
VTGFGDATRLIVAVTVAAFTVTETAADVLERKLAVPVYWAVRLYVPAPRDVGGSVATPEEFRVAVPSTVEPFMKLTVPVGTVVPFSLTVATRISA